MSAQRQPGLGCAALRQAATGRPPACDRGDTQTSHRWCLRHGGARTVNHQPRGAASAHPRRATTGRSHGKTFPPQRRGTGRRRAICGTSAPFRVCLADNCAGSRPKSSGRLLGCRPKDSMPGKSSPYIWPQHCADDSLAFARHAARDPQQRKLLVSGGMGREAQLRRPGCSCPLSESIGRLGGVESSLTPAGRLPRRRVRAA